MSFAYWMVLIAALLPYVTFAYAVRSARTAGVTIDNHAPRLSFAKLAGAPMRAYWAQTNHFEGFAPFAAAVIIAILAHVPAERINLLAGAYVAIRVVYSIAYIGDKAALRSILFGLGFLCVIVLLVSAATM